MLPEGGELPPEDFLPLIGEAAARSGVPLETRSQQLLAHYLARLDAARRRTNLTGPFPSEELAAHAMESIVGAFSVPPGLAVDVGAGAGFPGIPIAAVRADVAVLPVEPRRLRREFLDGCGRDLPLPNLLAARSSLRQVEPASAAAGLVRAVGDLAGTLGPAAFLRPGGILLAWTTDPEGLAVELAPEFALDGWIAVPHTDRKRIARFRKR